jgi:NADPH:quinone reductase-like Zn-dependent oxidoreductase
VEFAEVPAPVPAASQAIVTVAAASLTRGDLVALHHSPPGTVLGLDVVGRVTAAAANGTGPPAGTRVMGFTWPGAGGWAEQAAVDTSQRVRLLSRDRE